MAETEMTACRCFRYIAQMVEDPKVRELCHIGERAAKATVDELKKYTEAELIIKAKRKAK